MSWALVKNRLCRPTSRTSESPPRTTGMIRAVHASRRASPGLIRSPVSRTPAFCKSTDQGVEVDRDHDRGVGPADLRQVLRGDPFDELTERPAHPLGTGAAFHTGTVGGGQVLGGGDREEHLLQHRALQGRQREPSVDLPVPVVGHREPARLGGFGLLLLQEVRFVSVGQVGRDDLHQPPAEDRAANGRRAPALQPPDGCSAWIDQVGVEVVGECLDRTEDHPRLLRPEVTVRPDASRTWSWVREVVAEVHDPGCGGPGLPGLLGQPVRRRRGADVGGRPGARRHGSRPGPRARRPATASRAARPASTPFRSGPSTTPTRHHTVGDSAHLRGRRRHLVAGCGHRGHGSTQPLTTDSQRPRSPLSTGLQVTNRSRSSGLIHTHGGACGGWFRGSGLAALTPQPPGPRTAGHEAVSRPGLAASHLNQAGRARRFRGSGLTAFAPQPPGPRTAVTTVVSRLRRLAGAAQPQPPGSEAAARGGFEARPGGLAPHRRGRACGPHTSTTGG